MNIIKDQKIQYVIGGLIGLTLLGTIYSIYTQTITSGALKKYQADNDAKTEALTKKTADLETVLLSTQANSQSLADAVSAAQDKTNSLSDAFEEVNDNVSNLTKITTTDKELLAKYSKVYFLNENYAPKDLRSIPKEYTYDKTKDYQILSQVYSELINLIKTADRSGLDMKVISAFRSFGTQATLKGAYTVTYGSGSANAFSADQGYSEHQLGTTVDFTNPAVADTFSGFSKTNEYAWLLKNAYKYGFVLSYPENNAFYQFEPWHWRFVGVRLATYLHRNNKNFYDLTQREIDDYLVYLFD